MAWGRTSVARAEARAAAKAALARRRQYDRRLKSLLNKQVAAEQARDRALDRWDAIELEIDALDRWYFGDRA